MHGSIVTHSRSGAEDGDVDAEGNGELASRGRGRGDPRGGKGRGGRGRGGTRGGKGNIPNRDGQESSQLAGLQYTPGIENENEFPSLPGKETREIKLTPAVTKPVPQISGAPMSPASPLSPASGTWAEQVESSSK
jgi:hypothetical protein